MSYLKNVDMYRMLRFREWKLLELVFLKRKMSTVTQSFEPPRDKTNKMSVRPAKTRISLDAQSDQNTRCALNG